MNAELEALILALDAVRNARSGMEAKKLEAIYQSRIDDLQARVPGISRERLILMIASQHSKWFAAQNRYSSLPPKA